MNCLFCKIVSGEIPAAITYRDEALVVFDDINPQAPIHKLVVPHKHIATVNDILPEDNALMGHMVRTARSLASDLAIADDGYRLVMNCNAFAGQTIYHIHLHLLGGRHFKWPPG